MINQRAKYSESAAKSLLQVVGCPGHPACAPTLVSRMPSPPERIAEERGYFTVDGASLISAGTAKLQSNRREAARQLVPKTLANAAPTLR